MPVFPEQLLEIYFPYLLSHDIPWTKKLWDFPERLFLSGPALPVVLIGLRPTRNIQPNGLQQKKWGQQAHGKSGKKLQVHK